MAKPRKRPTLADKVSAPKVESSRTVVEIDQRIAVALDNLQELTEQAAAVAGGSIEESLH
jgi:hypothetical protein